MADSKKNSLSSYANSEYFFMKFSWIGPLVSRIDAKDIGVAQPTWL